MIRNANFGDYLNIVFCSQITAYHEIIKNKFSLKCEKYMQCLPNFARNMKQYFVQVQF